MSTETRLHLPILAIRQSVLFPGMVMPMSAGRLRSVAGVEAALASEDKVLAIFTQKDPSVEEPGLEDLYPVGVRALIRRLSKSTTGYDLVVQGLDRVRLLSLSQTDPYLLGELEPYPLPPDDSPELEALHRTVTEQAAQMLALTGHVAAAGQLASQITEPLDLVYFLASVLALGVEKEMAILQAASLREALQLLHEHLKHELQVLELRQKIASQAQSEMTKEQRNYLLRQQLRAIQQELGEEDPEKAELQLLRERLEKTEMPEEVRKEAERELRRLERLPAMAPDYQVVRTHLEFILELPWTVTTTDNMDLRRARQVLDEDHYGLEKVKDRILEHLAVMKLNPQARAPILCFVGPPGVGKTSLGQSIARALGRKFERFSLGGLSDEAELRGHRRTYVGALPGRLLQAIRRAGVKNPLLMLDEVDKLGQSFRGDPAAALLEIIDPAQNDKFRDNYLDLPFDLSKVFFILTANTLDPIPRPLRDRMEVIFLSGYTEEEKLQIARRYLLPRQLEHAGLKPEQLEVSDDTLRYIISRYTREAGVRELERQLGRVVRKLARRFVEEGPVSIRVEIPDLEDLLGPEKFFPEQARQKLPPGVAVGLAWTEAGGEVLYIEAVTIPGGKGLTLTGQLGEVMKESAQAAQSYLFSRAQDLGLDERLIRDTGTHLHVPEGAIPKDGPSAGIAMAVALAS
ncbi:MAG TPA: endopeptidase La, partial [Candidatus Nitrosotenuis sp.]|nr:endopeptidase La [Candidatus Nitrosotenuis sp.]